MFNWKNEIRKQLKANYGDAVRIKFKGNHPTLVFQDAATKRTMRSAAKLVEVLFEEMGGEVKFHPELARHTN